jgi:hypothetical protein
MTITTPRELRERFPYQFAGKHMGRTFLRGWFPTFVRLCRHIDELLEEDDKHRFTWVYLKEKWGSARFHWEMPGNEDAELTHDIRELVSQAERATEKLCVACSAPATINDDGGWYLALCDQHAEQRRTVQTTSWKFLRDFALFPPEDQ